ncbi:uncharacterized protein MYCGRDRAFT_104769, partial [Zymoseptoria tritici IPO323]
MFLALILRALLLRHHALTRSTTTMHIMQRPAPKILPPRLSLSCAIRSGGSPPQSPPPPPPRRLSGPSIDASSVVDAGPEPKFFVTIRRIMVASRERKEGVVIVVRGHPPVVLAIGRFRLRRIDLTDVVRTWSSGNEKDKGTGALRTQRQCKLMPPVRELGFTLQT